MMARGGISHAYLAYQAHHTEASLSLDKNKTSLTHKPGVKGFSAFKTVN